MCVHINDLPFELLEKILDLLEDKQQFQVERVSIKWQKCVLKLFELKKTLKRLDHYSDKFKLGHSYIVINNNNIKILKKILSKCPNIKELDLSWTYMIGDNNLIEIAQLYNKIESIDFLNSIIEVSKNEMVEFSKLIGPQLIKCNAHRNDDLKQIFFKHLKNIQDLSFMSSMDNRNKELFYHLNIECNHLKTLFWFCSLSEDDNIYQDEHFINVMQRIKHLKIELQILSRFKFNLNNLAELTLFNGNLNNIIGMTFVNLTKLNLLTHMSYDVISKLKFPKLESFTYSDTHYQIPLSFINQIKHIKSLYYYYNLNPLIIRQLNQLVEFVWKVNLRDDLITFAMNSLGQWAFWTNFVFFYQCLDALSKHKSLQSIQLKIYDCDLKIGNEFYEKLIKLCEAKPNTKTVIVIRKEDYQNCDGYKMLFYETKHLHKLNMEFEYGIFLK